MALFQVSVLKKYLKLQDDKIIDKAYKKFTSYFQHPEIQENIRKSKEEQFQATFLSELFVNILGYRLNPNPNYNLTTEFRNESNNRKADGAILQQGRAIGVIELKGTNTKHLEGIRQQAFDYKANQKNCVYVITSNFEKLRFYINDATEFLEFDLFELNPDDFRLLWLCLHHDNIMNGLPLKIKEASLVEEEAITKEFYKDYSVFKRELYRDLVKKNAKELKSIRHSELVSESLEDEEFKKEVNRLEKNVKLNLFKKSQKLIDRFLFVFFAEDRGLLPPNSIHKIITNWEMLQEMDVDQSLYERYKIYFNYLNTGRAAKGDQAEIFAYNGGLFKLDPILDMLEIDNELLLKHTKKLATYDFESQVDVNILGHIFENSLNEIESVNAEIEGADFDKQKSKRKKDGVFYTPKYITKYIVENTVGKLCEEKKTELGFREEEYFKGRKRRQKSTLEGLLKILDDYREWLLQLTICDPACGSGAFLNQALDFLIKEHRYIDEMRGKLLGESFRFPGIENTILENNIYGVDINEESVEIARLSLWLRTARPHRKLNDLSNNIKCGNSLIDDKKVAGDKAFKWEEEFPEIFKNGGFDVVIGNPPYGANLNLKVYSKIFSFTKKTDSYQFFVIKSKNLLKLEGICGLIIPNSWMTRKAGHEFRNKLIKFNFEFVIDFENQVFEDANIDTCIIIFSNKEISEKLKCAKVENPKKIIAELNYNEIPFSKWKEYDKFNCEFTKDVFEIFDKLLNSESKLEDLTKISGGYKPYQVGYGISAEGDFPQTEKDVKEWVYHSDEKINEDYYPDIKGSNINRYFISKNTQWVKWGRWLMSPKKYEDFIDPKIVVREVAGKNLNASYDEQGYFTNDTTHIIRNATSEDLKFYLSLINSRLYGYFFRKFFGESNKLFPKVKVNELKALPINNNQLYRSELIPLVDSMLKESTELEKSRIRFSDFLKSNFHISSLTRKLQNWHDLEFGDFIQELNKAIKKTNRERLNEGLEPVEELTKKDEFEWMELFEENKKKALELQQQIDETDRKIDQMVYELYGLTEEEIAIVENS